MIELTLKTKSTGEEHRYQIISANYSINPSEIRVSISMYQAVDAFILEWLKKEFQKVEKSSSFSTPSGKQNEQESNVEAILTFTTPQNISIRTIVLKNPQIQGYLSESFSGYPGAEQINSSFELNSQSYSIDSVQFLANK